MNSGWWFVIGFLTPSVLFFLLCLIINFLDDKPGKRKKIIEYFTYDATDKYKFITREEIKKIKFKKNYIKLIYFKNNYYISKKINYNCYICLYEEKNIIDDIPF